jgi:hypothetical protein
MQRYETAMLDALQAFRTSAVSENMVKTPQLYHFDPKTGTQVLEDLTDTSDLKTVLESPHVTTVLPLSIAETMGRTLGAWLQGFHSWAAEPAQVELGKVIGGNTSMRELRYSISYGAFMEIVQKFPDIWYANKTTLEEVVAMAKAEYATYTGEQNWSIINGDFWSGKQATPSPPSSFPNHPTQCPDPTPHQFPVRDT